MAQKAIGSIEMDGIHQRRQGGALPLYSWQLPHMEEVMISAHVLKVRISARSPYALNYFQQIHIPAPFKYPRNQLSQLQ